MKTFIIAIALAISAAGIVVGYEPQSAEVLSSAPETTPAYGVLVLRKVAVESELAKLSATLTNTHPDVVSKQYEFRALDREMNKLRAIDRSRASKLSSTVGELILRKVILDVELNDLRSRVTFSHPDLKQKRTELAALEREIQKIL
jgi:uncharacterized protein involved in exopolysaccharide biosynthesis